MNSMVFKGLSYALYIIDIPVDEVWLTKVALNQCYMFEVFRKRELYMVSMKS